MHFATSTENRLLITDNDKRQFITGTERREHNSEHRDRIMMKKKENTCVRISGDGTHIRVHEHSTAK